MEGENTTVCSKGATVHPGDHRRVHWALNLEEIMYFAADTDGKPTHSMLKKLKVKICAQLTKRQLTRLLDIGDRDLLHKLQEKIERIVAKLSGHGDEFIHTEDFNDLNKYWDELFDLYGEHEPGLEK